MLEWRSAGLADKPAPKLEGEWFGAGRFECRHLVRAAGDEDLPPVGAERGASDDAGRRVHVGSTVDSGPGQTLFGRQEAVGPRRRP